MSKVNFFFALCACLVSVQAGTADAQNVSLSGSTLTVQGSGLGDTIEVVPGTNSDGYIVRINGLVAAANGTAFFRSNQVNMIQVFGNGGNDRIFLDTNFRGDTLLDVNADLAICISGDAGSDEIDTGITGFGSKVLVYGGAGNDTMHSYYYELRGRRIFLSPPLLDYQIGDRYVSHRIGGTPISIRRF